MRRCVTHGCVDRCAYPCDGGKALMNLAAILAVSAALFCIGLMAALSRRHAIFILIGIEMMLAAANINFIAFWRFAPQGSPPTGMMVAIFAIAIAAAEAAGGFALGIPGFCPLFRTNRY